MQRLFLAPSSGIWQENKPSALAKHVQEPGCPGSKAQLSLVDQPCLQSGPEIYIYIYTKTTLCLLASVSLQLLKYLKRWRCLKGCIKRKSHLYVRHLSGAKCLHLCLTIINGGHKAKNLLISNNWWVTWWHHGSKDVSDLYLTPTVGRVSVFLTTKPAFTLFKSITMTRRHVKEHHSLPVSLMSQLICFLTIEDVRMTFGLIVLNTG